jgi:hypothetical protein
MTPKPSVRAGRTIDAQLHLLDRQVLDAGGVPITAVDDLELTDVPFDTDLKVGTPAPVIESLLSGPVLGTRIFGGRPPASRWHRIAWSALTDIGIALHLGVDGDELDVTWPERWVRDRVIGRIPGGLHDPE